MTPTLTEDERGQLIANADDVAHSFIDKWGRAVIGEPMYDSAKGWHIEVVGLLDDIQMDTVLVSPNGSRERIV